MMKLFEIPVYAMEKKELNLKYHQCAQKMRAELADRPEETIQRCIEIQMYPQRLWDYNHIVGYIVISVTPQDVVFHIYLPTPHKERYVWSSGRKTFLCDISANGTHFYVSDKTENRDIQKRTAEMLNGVINDHIPKRYFVDKEAFENLNGMIDYRTAMEKAVNIDTQNTI